MSSVGGNTIAFAKYFKHVNAIELNPKRKEMLDSNIKLVGLKNVDTYQGYAQDYIYNLKQDVIFFDPPWGGLDYRKETSMDITIDGPNGQEPFNNVAESTFGHCKYCVIKLPNNYNIEKLKKTMTKFKLVHIEWHGKPNSMVIMIFKAAA
jgi:16S rRNA G966 N2-methylase RsmD